MKTWEMIKELTKDTKLIFTRKMSDSGCNPQYVGMEVGCLYWLDTKTLKPLKEQKFHITSWGLGDNWELIPQEVTWQEAIQAWIEGKGIQVKINDWVREQPSSYKFGCPPGLVLGFDRDEFKKGKWYIR